MIVINYPQLGVLYNWFTPEVSCGAGVRLAQGNKQHPEATSKSRAWPYPEPGRNSVLGLLIL